MRNILCIAVAILLSITCIGQSADSSLKTNTRVKRYHVNYYVTGSIIAVGLVSLRPGYHLRATCFAHVRPRDPEGLA
jgi:hypothetical protein